MQVQTVPIDPDVSGGGMILREVPPLFIQAKSFESSAPYVKWLEWHLGEFNHQHGADEIDSITDIAIEIMGHTKGLNQSSGIWRDLPGGRMIGFGAMQLENDKFHFKGCGRDLMVFDEAGDFSESQVLFVTGWLRTTDHTSTKPSLPGRSLP